MRIDLLQCYHNMEEDIKNVLSVLFGQDKIGYFGVDISPKNESLFIVRVDPEMYPTSSSMRTHLSYIHLLRHTPTSYDGIKRSEEFIGQLFDLDISTGEKKEVSTKFAGGLYEVLKVMQPTLSGEGY